MRATQVLDGLPFPDGWGSAPLNAVAPRSRASGRPDLQSLSVYLDAGVVPRADRVDNHNALGEDLSKYLHVEPGDVVFNKLRTWQGGFGVARDEGIVSPAYFVCRPRPEVEPRFVHYLLHSAPYLAELTRRSKWMPPSQFDITWDELKTLPVVLPPLDEQRRVADFLDTATAHLTALATARAEQSRLLAEHTQATIDRTIEKLSSDYGVRTLRRELRWIEQGSSPQCAAVPAELDEYGVLKLSAVNRGRFRESENKALPATATPDKRFEVRPGDLLMSRANTPDRVGDVAFVAETRARLLLPDLLYRLTLTDPSDAEFVAVALRSRRVRGLLTATARGTSQSMVKLRGEDIADLPIPAAPRDERARVARAARRVEAVDDSARARIDDSLELLAERRSALVTAAVTGQFDVTTSRAAHQ